MRPGTTLVSYMTTCLDCGIDLTPPPQCSLRGRVRSVFDRQELTELLSYLEQEGCIERKVACADKMLVAKHIGLLEAEDERRTFWFVKGGKHWYEMPGLSV